MYEDYMQNLLGGYPYSNTYVPNTRECDCFSQMDDYPQYGFSSDMFGYDMNSSFNMYDPVMSYNYSRNNLNLEELYPEIYKIIYPMVQKASSKITRPIDEDLIEKMAQDIYSNIEAGNIVNLNINIDNDNTVNGTQTSTSSNRSSGISKEKTQENRSSEDRQFRNTTLLDLIKILLLREFSGRPGNRPPRPRPPRPPFPGPGPRPPMPPRPRY